MARATFTATVADFMAPYPNLINQPLYGEPREDGNRQHLSLSKVRSGKAAILHCNPPKSQAVNVELAEINTPERAYFTDSTPVKKSNSPTRSEESSDSSSPVFTSGKISTRSSQKSTPFSTPEKHDIEAKDTGVPHILLNDKPLNLEKTETRSGPIAHEWSRYRRRHITAPKRGEARESSSSSTKTAKPLPQIDWFKFPPSLYTVEKQPLTASVFKSLASTMLKWRMLTFYGPFFPAPLQQRLVEEAQSCLVLRAGDVSCVDWAGMWRMLEGEQDSSRSLKKALGKIWEVLNCATVDGDSGAIYGSMTGFIKIAAKELGFSAEQLELAIRGLGLASDPKMRSFSALGLVEMKDWDFLARMVLVDGEMLAHMTKPPMAVARVVGEQGRRQGGREEGKGKATGVTDCYAALLPLLPTLKAAHRACRMRYFQAVGWEERRSRCGCDAGSGGGWGCFGGCNGKGKAMGGRLYYKLSRDEEGNLGEQIRLEEEMRAVKRGASRVGFEPQLSGDKNRKA